MQREQNPDVNSTNVGDDRETNDDVEREPIPVPPDIEDPYPVVDPPLEADEPLVDVDDSPKRIAGS
ncbi:MAG: hypothetical protein ABIU09_07690 [Pyrinomonadaceae bacterium]